VAVRFIRLLDSEANVNHRKLNAEPVDDDTLDKSQGSSVIER
jgi:hypothetical protein